MTEFTSETVLVTGAGSGIGRETATQFAAEGAAVVVADVDVAGARETKTMCEQRGGDALVVEADVTDMDDVASMVATAVEEWGSLDYAINNAGVGGESAVVEHTEESWSRTVDTNLTGVWRCLKHELDQMAGQDDGGVVVNISSVLGLVGTERAAAYVASKHGVTGLTKAAAIEHADDDIRVNAVCPGYIDTSLSKQGRSEERVRELADRHPMRRFGRTGEVADAVLWVCSDGASFVTGEALSVDGGYTSR